MPNRGSSETPRRRSASSVLDGRLREAASYLFKHNEFSKYVDRPDITPYIGVVSIMTFLKEQDGQPLTATEATKLKKMLGLQARITPQNRHLIGQKEFWKMADDLAGPEIAKAAGFAEDLSDIPKSWQPARISLEGLQDYLQQLEAEAKAHS